MDAWFESVLALLALPKFGLSTVFVVALVSATLLPLGSEPVVYGLVVLNPDLFWPAILVATAGNTVGGAISWWMGYGAERAYEHYTHRKVEARALRWLEQFGAKACLLSWLPVVGDPLCAVAGWLRLPFWPCVFYMAIGKFARYLTMTAALLWVLPALLPWFPALQAWIPART
jgi:membrane protein YqaA with SNARE-associated domain